MKLIAILSIALVPMTLAAPRGGFPFGKTATPAATQPAVHPATANPPVAQHGGSQQSMSRFAWLKQSASNLIGFSSKPKNAPALSQEKQTAAPITTDAPPTASKPAIPFTQSQGSAPAMSLNAEVQAPKPTMGTQTNANPKVTEPQQPLLPKKPSVASTAPLQPKTPSVASTAPLQPKTPSVASIANEGNIPQGALVHTETAVALPKAPRSNLLPLGVAGAALGLAAVGTGVGVAAHNAQQDIQ